MASTRPFHNDWISTPGDTISDVLKERAITVSEFATAIELTTADVVELLEGRVAITIALARKLTSVLGASVEFWMAREGQYRDDLIRLNEVHKDWLEDLPIKDMIKFHWLKPLPHPSFSIAACLKFFNVPSVTAWSQTYKEMPSQYAFKNSPTFSAHPMPVTAWLRQGELQANIIECADWDLAAFQAALPVIRSLTRLKDPSVFFLKLQNICAKCGVAVVAVRAPKGCPVSGATRFLSPKKAILQLSFRFLSDDHFWFSFFHEAGHLLLHGEKGFFIEGESKDKALTTREEKEADEFAESILVPNEYKLQFAQLSENAIEIVRFSKKVGVSPGIVLGQLQHFGFIDFKKLNKLKRRYQWSG